MAREALIPVGHGKFSIVDEDDYIRFGWMKWHLNDQGYVNINSRKHGRAMGFPSSLRLHRLITACPSDMEVDHKNGNPLDNRKENLRVCTHRENIANRDVVKKTKKIDAPKGVTWEKNRKRWQSIINTGEKLPSGRAKRKFLGYFETKEDAAIAYQIAAEKMYGNFAYHNSRKVT